ncbi:MAG TPA: hypothetical protein VMQ56_18040, partial [Terracidiphilus sp.]|nr:hypothetical protein [Terracidiphilus sp.]
MATSDFWARVLASVPSSASPSWQEKSIGRPKRRASSKGRFWIVLDVITVVGAAALATIYKFRTTPVDEVKGFWHGTLIHGRSMGIL